MMRALTLHQPWASLVDAGVKTIETRSWRPPADVTGEWIAIHASQKRRLRRSGVMSDVLMNAAEYQLGVRDDEMPRGAVIALAHVYWTAQVEKLVMDRTGRTLAHLKAGGHVPADWWGDYSDGRWLIKFDAVRSLPEPVPAVGRQRFWNWEPPSSLLDLWPDVERSLQGAA